MGEERRPGDGPTGRDPLAGWSRLPAAVQAPAAALAFLLGALVASGVAPQHDRIFALWPAAGIGLVALLLTPARRWPLMCVAIGGGSAAFGLLHGVEPAFSAGLAAADTIGVLTAAVVTCSLTRGRRPDLGALRHVLALVAGGGVAGAAAGGACAAAVVAAARGGDFARSWLEWAGGVGSGILLVAPLFLAVARDGREPLPRERRVEGVACLLASALVASLTLELTDLPLSWLVALPLLWAALRLGPLVTAFSTCAAGVVTLAITADGTGHLAALARTPSDALLLAQGLVYVMVALPACQAAAIAERERAAARLRKSELQLRQARKMEGIGRLAGMIAHDFNNLLTVVEGYARLGLDRAARGEDPSGELREICAARERGSALTSRLTSFARARSARVVAVDLDAVVADACGRLRRLLGGDQRLALRLGDAGPVSVDAGALEQALSNLVANAGEAMPDGGVVTVETAGVHLDDAAAPGVPPGAWAVVTVSDGGRGMDEATRERALEPFFTTKPEARGSGLGLPEVYGIAEQAGGALTVDSRPGDGTTVRLYLPPAGAPAALPAALPSGPAGAPAGVATLLLAEDDPSLRVLCRTVLFEAGFDVIEAADGVEALVRAAEHDGEIDLLVSDIVMPRMGGPELYRRLAGRRPGLRVLFTSGHPERDVTPSGTLDRDNFLPKPYTPAELVRRVRALLEA